VLLQEFKEIKDLKDSQVRLDSQGLEDSQVHLEVLEILESLDPQVFHPLDYKVHVVQLELQAQQVQLDVLDPLDMLDLLVL
jgi:transcriptional accessory protein Tex/SPT6